MWISLTEAAADDDTLRDQLINGDRKAIGLANGEGLPIPIPNEHFAIAWERLTPVGLTAPSPNELFRGWLPGMTYAEPWLDVIDGNIYAADGSIRWASIRVDGREIERTLLPRGIVPRGRSSVAALNALRRLYGGRGYPTKASVQQITDRVNAELRKMGNAAVSKDTVDRLLDRRRS